MKTVHEYIDNTNGIGRDWILEMVDFLESEFPDKKLIMSYGIPMIKLENKHFVGFGVNKDFFSLHTIDYDESSKLRAQLSFKDYSKATTRVRYSLYDDFQILKQFVINIIKKHSK